MFPHTDQVETLAILGRDGDLPPEGPSARSGKLE